MPVNFVLFLVLYLKMSHETSGVQDMVALEEISDKAIADNLHIRLKSDIIYVSSVRRKIIYWQRLSLKNLIKQLFHSRLLDMRFVIPNSALRASLANYHLISNARLWNSC